MGFGKTQDILTGKGDFTSTWEAGFARIETRDVGFFFV